MRFNITQTQGCSKQGLGGESERRDKGLPFAPRSGPSAIRSIRHLNFLCSGRLSSRQQPASAECGADGPVDGKHAAKDAVHQAGERLKAALVLAWCENGIEV